MDSTCPYCQNLLPTLQGQRAHLSLFKDCRQKQFEEYDVESESESDRDESAGNASHDGDFDGGGVGGAGSDFFDGGMQSQDPDAADSEDDVVDPPRVNSLNQPSIPQEDNSKKRRRATVEEVEDEDARWFQPFPEARAAGAILAECQTQFEKLREDQKSKGQAPWSPFESEDEWELARWLMTSGISQKKTDAYLNLKTVREGSNPSFHNNRAFLQRIDALPEGPKWRCYPFELVGDELNADGEAKKEIVEMWCRDPVECVRELVGNPAFTEQVYEPCRIFKKRVDGKYSNREFNEMWTADWWWDIQELLPVGATLVPIIIATDKTQLTRFSGDQQAWPVYLTIGNIDMETRHGVMMDCADGFVRKMYLILAAYIADYPEQCLVCCCGENSCPGCTCAPKSRGDTTHAEWRDREKTLQILKDQANGEYPPEFVEQNLRAINPFWADLPHCEIFRAMTPDILHELHNGVFGDHAVKWTTAAMSGEAAEVDRRFRAMTPHPCLRHFKKGISLTTQWTGHERKNMEKVFLGVLAGATHPRVQLAARGILDFIYYAHFETHCDESLMQLDAAWLAFHNNKAVLVELDIRTHFNISKLHKMKHYVDSIRSRGSAAGFNTEGTERLHIDLAKVGYQASNKKAYTRQMTVWLRRQESVHKFGSYLQWAVPGYLAPLTTADLDSDADDDDDEDVDSTVPVAHASVDPPDDSDDEGDELSLPTFSIAKKPAFPTMAVTTIVADFHAPAFLDNLAEFLHSKSIIPLLVPTENSVFPVYKRFSLSLPPIREVGSSELRDTIRAVKREPLRLTPKGVKPEKAGQFDTVLARTKSSQQNAGPTDGLCVARVRVIFRIPSNFGEFSDPVAYVDWFKPLQAPVAGLGMHQVSLSSRNLRQRSSIIPVSEIARSCHLIPVFGRAADAGWTSDTVLDRSKSFYLNPYLRHHDFYLFRYLVSVHAAKKEAEDRRVRIRLHGRAGR
ncbi:hypothetical protein C8R47DRAFT_996166 [Mycena vitilis]|nr:hypothetical protein C8R47DRAFT_996166 [Mycena vitilis]